jgi:hypothetical protein
MPYKKDSCGTSIIPFELRQESGCASSYDMLCAPGSSDKRNNRGMPPWQCANRPRRQSSFDVFVKVLVPFTVAERMFPEDAESTMARQMHNRHVGAILHQSAVNAFRENPGYAEAFPQQEHPESASFLAHAVQIKEFLMDEEDEGCILDGYGQQIQVREPEGQDGQDISRSSSF